MMHENDSLFVLLIPLWSSTLLKAIPFHTTNFGRVHSTIRTTRDAPPQQSAETRQLKQAFTLQK